MNPIQLHLSHLNNSNVRIEGGIQINIPNSDSRLVDFLLQCMEINRRLIVTIHADWENEEDLYTEIHHLIEQQKLLEVQVADHLNP